MKKNRFIEGAMIATIGIFLTKILGVVYVIPFYAIIGERGGALYGYAYSIYMVFLNLSSVGIPLAISRLTSEYNALGQHYLKEKTFVIGKRVITILSVVFFIALIVFAPNISYMLLGDVKGGNSIEDITYVIRIIATAILVVPTLSVTKGYLQGHKYITPTAVSQVIEQFARVIIIIAGSYVAINVLGLPIKAGVGIATFGATVGGLIAYLYLLYKMRKERFSLKQEEPVSRETVKISNKSVILRILSYAAPFIVSNVLLSLYNIVDLVTVVKTMVDVMHYGVNEAETVMSIFSTWGSKLSMIVASVASGIVTSLIPNITGSFVKNDLVDVRSKINKSLQILFYTTIPMTIGLSLISMPVWTFFYGYSALSTNMFQYYIYTALFSSIITTANVILQSLNEQVRMLYYIAIGFAAKMLLNIPLMYSFYRLGLHAGHGATTATILGYAISSFLILLRLYRKVNVNYEETVKKTIKIICSCLVMAIVILLMQFVLPINTTHRLPALVISVIYSIVGIGIYSFITIKNKLLFDIFGDSFIDKILCKLHLKRA